MLEHSSGAEPVHITASRLQFSMQHQFVARHEVRESLRVWREPAPAPVDTAAYPEAEVQAGETDDLNLLFLRLLLERLTGRKLRLVDVAELTRRPAGTELEAPTQPRAGAAWGATYDREEFHNEQESTTVNATGLIRAADGQQIAVELSLTMSRVFSERTGIHLRAGTALKDPLVVNFDGRAAQLSDRRMEFDLDADGEHELVPLLAPGTALLALDRNGNGRIDDGSELFGALSGDGFTELAGEDEDRNGWIDEADSVFERLRLWWHDADGESRLTGLADEGIGAIALTAVESPFQLKTGAELQGQVRSTGLYLAEDGTAGTVQQVDFKV